MGRKAPRCRDIIVIPIRNIYYMLAYAFTALKAQEYAHLETEDFEQAEDLYAQILITGIRAQLKRGIVRTYENREEELSCIRGKIDFQASLAAQSMQRGRLICRHDEHTEDNDFNRILCSVAAALLSTPIATHRKKALRNLLNYFPNVQRLPLRRLNWRLPFNSRNQHYRLIIGICQLIANAQIQSRTPGKTKLLNFEDERHENQLYEKFLLAYFQQTFKGIRIASRKIPWNISEGTTDMLPGLRSDIMVSDTHRTLIIDAKYYKHILQEYYGHHSHHPHNLNQILNYVHQESAAHPADHEVSGMLLYAGTEENVPEKEFVTCGKRIHIKTLDLSTDFPTIRKTLNDLIEHYFPGTAES